MNREQAVRINDHLLDACEALDRARMAIAALGKTERIELGDWLVAIVGALEDKLLLPIYEQHPELEPPAADLEEPTVTSELTWNDVQLPPSVTEQRFDEIIFSVMERTWRKTAMMVWLVVNRCKELGLSIDDEMVAARLKALSDSDRIEGIGDLRMWRHSEVRLKD
ncbi:hypothetical protein IVA87_00505 [Bradyrhizobium sp. 147]|jgi:hypothetical protein|uniref:DUF3658 domain-containing protein n=1 Tax=unclassified Bradyrhizobium TaxID=2631580 RepID=UPI001FF7016E|nr:MULTISPECIES: DUF3658 domain-containing protein [unclassified Bradyrhizobium]MCK1543074.1 hypothetical protein [Bradyrhizobium sp. 179]MCK1627684.1 hypothetical protein [Bradyrhizobium sp. 160]MCK1677989.1 hypothetical protein [Bradyrhizobium sp. 147]